MYRARFPWEGPPGLDHVPSDDPRAGERPAPATADQLGAGALVTLDPDDGRERRLRGRDGAARAYLTEAQRRGIDMTWDRARERAGAARARAARMGDR